MFNLSSHEGIRILLEDAQAVFFAYNKMSGSRGEQSLTKKVIYRAYPASAAVWRLAL